MVAHGSRPTGSHPPIRPPNFRTAVRPLDDSAEDDEDLRKEFSRLDRMRLQTKVRYASKDGVSDEVHDARGLQVLVTRNGGDKLKKRKRVAATDDIPEGQNTGGGRH